MEEKFCYRVFDENYKFKTDYVTEVKEGDCKSDIIKRIVGNNNWKKFDKDKYSCISEKEIKNSNNIYCKE